MKDLRLVQKLTRKAKLVKKAASAYGHVDKADKLEETMEDSPGVYKLMVKVQRKLDGKLGKDMVAREPAIAFRLSATTLERYDFGGLDYGMRLELPSGMIEATRVRPGDIVEVLEGLAQGKMLEVVSIPDSTHVRLEDIASYVGPESNVVVRFELSTVKKGYN